MADAPDNAKPVEHKHVAVSKKLVAINSASQVVARVLNITVLLWAYQYLLKRIPAEEFAILPIVSANIAMASLFFSLFVDSPLLLELSELFLSPSLAAFSPALYESLR